MKDSGTFVRVLSPTDTNNIVTLIDFNQILLEYQQYAADNIISHAIVLNDLQAKVGLFSLLESDWPNTNALASESAQEAAWAKIKKEGQKVYLGLYHAYGNGPWIKKGEEILQNKNSLEQPWALMQLFCTKTTASLDEDLKIGIRIESKAQGIGGLKSGDYITVSGGWQKLTEIIKKKDDRVDALAARIEILESLAGRLTQVPANTLLGRNNNTGAVENIPQNTFAKPGDIDAAISSVIFGAPTTLNTLDELAAALADDPNFSQTIINQLALKAPISNPRFTGFVGIGDAVIKIKQLEGLTSSQQNQNTQIPHGIPLGKIKSFNIGVNAFSSYGLMPMGHKIFAGYEYYAYIQGEVVVIFNTSTNSANILNKPVIIEITYVE